jgi:hypothetical protein
MANGRRKSKPPTAAIKGRKSKAPKAAIKLNRKAADMDPRYVLNWLDCCTYSYYSIIVLALVLVLLVVV